MSIMSDLFHGKITFAQAAVQIENWFAKQLGALPPGATADVQAAKSALKQVASDAVGLADTALGVIIGGAALTVEGAVNTAFTAALGPSAATLTPAADAAITHIANGIKAAADAEAAKLRAQLSTPPAVTMAPISNPTAAGGS